MLQGRQLRSGVSGGLHSAGQDLTHDEVIAHHHAVNYAVGVVAGSYAALDFVGWYNGHADHAGHEFDRSAHRVVIIGNGNVRVKLVEIDTLLTAARARLD